MSYELHVERESPLAFAELARAIAPAGFSLREPGEILAGAHPVARWRERVVGTPASDWDVAQLVRLAAVLGGRLRGEDGEHYYLRDGVIEVDGDAIGDLDQILRQGPAAW
ncbi:hypothetical protein ACFXJ8_06870 [Nonomuraea sp. NPDC059194]|uniref:hypothetical protein n=1 Tax=Nonomuraea sp. NPDC059194 TaxID=3346764 RepID=UPI0036A498CD